MAALGGIGLQRICTSGPLHISHDLTNKGVAAQFFRVHYLAVHNAALGQPLPYLHRVNIFKVVLFLLGEELVPLNELGDPALDLGPRHIARSAVRRDRERGQAVAILLLQPCGGVFFPPMLLHVADHGPLALHVPVPVPQGRVNVRLGQRPMAVRGRDFRLVRDLRAVRRPCLVRIGFGLMSGNGLLLVPCDLLFRQQADLPPGQAGNSGRVEIIALPHMELVRETTKTDGGPIAGRVLMQDLAKPQAQIADPQMFLRVVGKELGQGLPGGAPIFMAQNFREILFVEGRQGGRRRADGLSGGLRDECVQGKLLRLHGRRIGGAGHRGRQRFPALLKAPHDSVPAAFFHRSEIVLSGCQLLQPCRRPAPWDVYGPAGLVTPELDVFRGIDHRPVASVLIGLAVGVKGPVFLLQKGYGGLCVRHPQEQGVNPQLAVQIAGPPAQLRVPLRVGDGKSGGRFHALRFRDRLPLFLFRGEQGQLLFLSG